MAVKRSCYLCSEKYSYCDCNRQPAFMATFCSENCHDIFKSLSSYGTGAISAEECKELLDCCDLSNKESYKESTRNTIDKVYTAHVATIEESEVVVDVVDEPVAELIIEDEVKPILERKRKRNHEVVLEDTE